MARGERLELDGARVLVAGATGVLGGSLVREFSARGAALAVAGRQSARLQELSGEFGAHTEFFDAYDLDGAGDVVARSAEALGGLDVVVVAVGAVAFGAAESLPDDVAEHLFAVNTLAPIALLRAALPLLRSGGAIAALTGVVSERPMPGMAVYSASKAALSAWLTAVRIEQRRRGVRVVDARLPHMETGFADRAVAGRPPRLPPGADLEAAIRRIVDAVETGTAEVG